MSQDSSSGERAVDHIDLVRYPIGGSNQPLYEKVVADARLRLADDGCCVLPAFISKGSIPLLERQADTVAHCAHRSFNRTNPYFSLDDPSLPEEDPRRRFYDRSNAFVPADMLGEDSVLRAIYEYEPFRRFIKDTLEAERFFRYADPLADVIINVVEEGEGFPWHFDTNNYTITVSIANGERGGVFEYAPNLRTSADERFDDVREVLDGRSDRVRAIDLVPGDLQIFKGRYSLHRVTPVEGSKSRYVGIFSFVDYEGMVGSIERTRQLYGRVLPIHRERAGQRGDGLKD